MNNNSSKLILPARNVILELDKGFRPCSTRSWSRDIKKLYGGTCVISNRSNKEARIVVHHLYAKAHYPQHAFSLLNGLPLTHELHKELHSIIGLNCTSKSFINYIDILYRTDQRFDKGRLLVLKDWVSFLDTHINF